MTKIYLKNKDLYYEIIVSKGQGKLTRRAELMLYKLAKKIIMKFHYTNPLDREDCLQEGLLQMYKNWNSFDELKTTNAFAYFTEIFKRGSAQGFNSLYKKDYITGDYYRPINFSQLYKDENSEINI